MPANLGVSRTGRAGRVGLPRSTDRKRKPAVKRVQFALDAPEAREVAVTGTFCHWSDGFLLRKQRDGRWKRTMRLPPGRYEYSFVVDGRWRPDPAHRNRTPNPFGGQNSVLQVS